MKGIDGSEGGHDESALFAIDEAVLEKHGLRIGKQGRRTHVPIETNDDAGREECDRRVKDTLKEWRRV